MPRTFEFGECIVLLSSRRPCASVLFKLYLDIVVHIPLGRSNQILD
jgi:hypothetical protein